MSPRLTVSVVFTLEFDRRSLLYTHLLRYVHIGDGRWQRRADHS
jgi:hypothetical protein